MTAENNKRIAKNTAILYLRMLFTVAVSLYTSRIVLNTLGEEDFGIYNVVGGVVIMFSSFSSSMDSAVQRFMNFEMGRNNHQRLNAVFNTSVFIHICIAVLVFVLLELIGVWFLNAHMNIPQERMGAANWVLQFSILSFMVIILSVPYKAIIIANEKFSIYAYISILEVSLRLIIVFILVKVGVDKLKLYAVLAFLVSLVVQIIYVIYASRNFNECNFRWYWDKSLFKEMMSFAGWNMIGVTSRITRTQGVNVVLNLFFGVVVNAAMGIANKVKSTLEEFVNNIIKALNPQITKSFASGKQNYLMQLVFYGARYVFYLLLFLTLPIILETEYILLLWLKLVPDYAVIFVRLILVLLLIESLSKTLIQTMFAAGKIRNYQLVVGSITILNLPLATLFLYWEFPPPTVFVISIGLAIISLMVRLVMLEKMVGLQVKVFFKKVLINVLFVASITMVLPLLLLLNIEPGFKRFILVTSISLISLVISTYFIGLSTSERVFVKSKIIQITNKITNN